MESENIPKIDSPPKYETRNKDDERIIVAKIYSVEGELTERKFTMYANETIASLKDELMATWPYWDERNPEINIMHKKYS